MPKGSPIPAQTRHTRSHTPVSHSCPQAEDTPQLVKQFGVPKYLPTIGPQEMWREPHSKQELPQASLCATEKHQSRRVPPSPGQARWLPRGHFAAPVLTSPQKQMHTRGECEWRQQCDNYTLISLTPLRQIAWFML